MDEFTITDPSAPKRKDRNTKEIDETATTVFVSNLPLDYTDSTLETTFEKCGVVRRAFVVCERGKAAQSSRGFGYVIFSTVEEAESAVSSMNETKVGSNLITVSIAKPRQIKEESIPEAETESEPVSVSGIPKSLRDASTVLLSNLSKSTTQKKLFKRVKKVAEVTKIIFPGPEGANTARIILKKPKDTQTLVDKLNGHVFLGNELKVDFVHLKAARLVLRNVSFDCKEEDIRKLMSDHGRIKTVHIPLKPDGKSKGFAFVQYHSVYSASVALEHFTKEHVGLDGRPIAVDWAIQKDLYKELEDQQKRIALAEKAEEKEKLEESQENFQKELPKVSKDVSDGRTVFLKNVPFIATKEELERLFTPFGSIKKVSIVQKQFPSGDTMPKGTAFIEFRDADSAMKCIKASASADEASQDLSTTMRNSAAARAIASEGVGGIWLHGRLLDVAKAIPRDECAPETETKTDKRNLYLAREGLVLKESLVGEDLPKAYIDRRTALWSETKAKLDSPNYWVSATRLSVHNLPLAMQEKELGDLFLKSAKKSVPNSKLKQVKVVRDKERVDADGLLRSKRFGFVEFMDHQSALAALRDLNNNPHVLGKTKRLIVAFAIDDARKMHVRNTRIAKDKGLKRKSVPEEMIPQKKVKVEITKETPRVVKPKQKKVEAPLEGMEQKSKGKAARSAEKVPRNTGNILKSSEKTEKMPKKQKVDSQEENFDSLVEAYQKKLIGSKIERSAKKWYDLQ